MSITAAALKKMREMGLTLDQAIEIADALTPDPTADESPADRKRRLGRARQARYEERQKTSETASSDANPDAVSFSPTPPNPSVEPTPFTPLKGGVSPSPKAKPSRRAPEVWAPSSKVVAVGQGLGFSPGEIERQLAKFRDHEFRSPRSDWDAAFRNWLRETAERRPPGGPANGQRPDHQTARPTAQQDNLARAWAGSEIAVGDRR